MATSVVSGGYLLLLLRTWPRVFLRRYPEEIRNVVAPLSARERSLGLAAGMPFLVSLLFFPVWASYRVATESDGNFGDQFLAAYLTWMAFNLFDWLVIDELVIGRFRPDWLILPGAEQIPLNFGHSEHAIAFAKGTVGGALLSLLIAGAVNFVV